MKFKLFISLFFIISISFGQNQNKEDEINYNKWSVDFGAGVNKPTRGLSSGYFVGPFENLSAEFGARYMFNDRIGIKVNTRFDNFQEDSNTPQFDTQFYQFNVDGVVNLRQVLKLNDFTEKFNLLLTGGLGYAFTSFGGSSRLSNEGTDNILTVNGGLIPQYKITDKFALNLNLGLSGLIRQNIAFDGNSRINRRGFKGVNYRATLGFSIYLGKEKEHADWADVTDSNDLKKQINKIRKNIAELEDDFRDTDKDGIPDYLDKEPNTPGGVAVNNKGVSIDENENGIPDDLETILDQKYASSKSVKRIQESSQIAKTLANNGYINVYFRFNSTKPETYSLNAINQIVEYMRANPRSNAILTGYSDAIGNSQYNFKLSEDRAKRVYEILVSAGIKESRMSYKGGGVDDSVDKSSKEARQLTRRVKFELR